MNPFHGQALIVVGDASETLEMLYPYDRLIEAGIRPVIAGPERRPYQRVMHEVKPGWTISGITLLPTTISPKARVEPFRIKSGRASERES